MRGFITLPNVSLGAIKEVHVKSLRTMGMEGLLQIAGHFHMGQLKKLTVKPFTKQIPFLQKGILTVINFGSFSSFLLNIATTGAFDLKIRAMKLIITRLKKLSICISR